MLIAVALIAGLLLAATIIRVESSAPSARFGAYEGGLRLLGENERLVAFESYTFDAGAWPNAAQDDSNVSLGGILGPNTLETQLSREIVAPDQTARLIMTFDLIAMDVWALEALEVRINEDAVLTARLSTLIDQQNQQSVDIDEVDGIEVALVQMENRAAEDTANGTTEESALVLRLFIAILDPAASTTLAIQGFAAENSDLASEDETTTPDTGPQWALDNLMISADLLP